MSRRAIVILLATLLFLSGCNPPAEATSLPVQSPTSRPRTPSPTPDAVLTDVKGEVSLQQIATGQVVPASFGDLLWRGDVIVTGREAQAEAVCSDGLSIRVDPNQSMTVTCGETPLTPYPDVILRVHEEQIEALPMARPIPLEDESLPVILSPHHTQLTARPTIRWQAVQGAEGYEVVVRGPDRELWEATTQESELPYPEAEPALEAGVHYLIQITAQMGPIEVDRSSEPVMVSVLSPAEVEEVGQFEAQVKALGLSEESAHFFLAAYYIDKELYDAAITELVPLVEAAPSPAAHRLLGYVYLTVGLNDQAAGNYQAAYRLAQAEGNRLVQAEAEVGLGHLAFSVVDFKRALSHYQAALDLYQALGLESEAEAVAKLVADTKARLPTPTP